MPASPRSAVQPTFIDLGVPLSDVTFACVDLETAGGSPPHSRITEIGAVKYRGGERRGTFHTLVDPGLAIPPFITYLTGIDDILVRGAPDVEAVLPSLVEFLRGAVFVAHNASFDFRFLNHDLVRAGYEPITGPPVCTAKLARRVLGEDVRNVRLATLAEHFRTAVRPLHRAGEDAEACAEVLHALLDLGGRLGILTLRDLGEAGRARGRPHFAKIRLTDQLPSRRVVYLPGGRPTAPPPSAPRSSSGPFAAPSPPRAGSSKRSRGTYDRGLPSTAFDESVRTGLLARATIQMAAAAAPMALYTRSHPVFT
ncbi:MAG TPA: exonuclease domain-containing protein [Actinomycetota bacterium]|jgi:DNA polymerase-3 subunit epsilon|nr:exonuclease domain-containing protein [Actinomycetota bacterium]